MLDLLPAGAARDLLANPWFHGLVATVALAGPGRRLLLNGARGLLHGAPGMDSLVGVGLASSYGASLVGLLWPASGWPCFFNEPVMLLGFVLSGRFLEERARYRTGWARFSLKQPSCWWPPARPDHCGWAGCGLAMSLCCRPETGCRSMRWSAREQAVWTYPL